MKHYLAIDPGDRWVGYAIVHASRTIRSFDTGVLDLGDRSFNDAVDTLFASVPAQASVITEAYRVRPVGSQRFSASPTLQLIGAIRYVATVHRATHWEIPAGSPLQVWETPIAKYLKTWQRWWPTPKDKRWDHALSAWRVLMTWCVKHDAPWLVELSEDTTRRHGTVQNTMPLPLKHELIAPNFVWTHR